MTFNIIVVLVFVGRGGRWYFGPVVKRAVAKKKFENHCSNWIEVFDVMIIKLVVAERPDF